MSDIVEVLNEIVERHDCSHPAIVSKASAEITRLTAEIEKLKADLAFADAQCAKVEGLFLGTHASRGTSLQPWRTGRQQRQDQPSASRSLR